MHQLRGPARAGAGQSATRRPAIRRRKLQPSAPPPAVGGALASNGSAGGRALSLRLPAGVCRVGWVCSGPRAARRLPLKQALDYGFSLVPRLHRRDRTHLRKEFVQSQSVAPAGLENCSESKMGTPVSAIVSRSGKAIAPMKQKEQKKKKKEPKKSKPNVSDRLICNKYF